MNAQQKTKLENRLKEIESIYYDSDSDKRHNLICERNEIEFKINKENINFRLTGYNKYYHAAQCSKFVKNVFKYGYLHKTPEELKESGICFNTYSINAGYNQYCEDLKRFNSKEELLGFVIGFNQCIWNMEYKKSKNN